MNDDSIDHDDHEYDDYEYDEEELQCDMMDPLHVILEQSANPDEEWLWCIFCERFFQARYVRMDYLGNRQGCAFCECAGFDCALFKWDTWKDETGGEIWPRSEAELHHGLRLADLNRDYKKGNGRP